MNHTIIHDRAGLNQFYAKVYAFVGLGIGLSALVSGLMLTVFQSQLVYFLMQIGRASCRERVLRLV